MRAQSMQGLHQVRRDAASVAHLQVLVRLRSDGPLRVSRLAHCLDVSPASATGMVDRMVERGLVERVRDEADRRVVLVRLAPPGRALLEKIGSRGRAGLARVLERLDEDELVALKTGLAAFVGAARAVAEAEVERGRAGRDDCAPPRHARAGRHREASAERGTPHRRRGARTRHAAEDPE